MLTLILLLLILVLLLDYGSPQIVNAPVFIRAVLLVLVLVVLLRLLGVV